jgi:hypothetical protein
VSVGRDTSVRQDRDAFFFGVIQDMKAIGSFETSGITQRTTQCFIPKEFELHEHCAELSYGISYSIVPCNLLCGGIGVDCTCLQEFNLFRIHALLYWSGRRVVNVRMLRYVMFYCIILRYVMLRYFMLYYVILLCCVTLRYRTLSYVIVRYVALHNVMLSYEYSEALK